MCKHATEKLQKKWISSKVSLVICGNVGYNAGDNLIMGERIFVVTSSQAGDGRRRQTCLENA